MHVNFAENTPPQFLLLFLLERQGKETLNVHLAVEISMN